MFFKLDQKNLEQAGFIVEADKGEEEPHRLVRPPRMKASAFLKIVRGLPWEPLTADEARQQAEEE